MRLQLALNVRDLDEAVRFYSKLFNTKPHKVRAGYANYSISSPPLKLVLFENPDAKERLNHLGVEVFRQEDLAETTDRLQANNMVEQVEINETCCHATQDKIWTYEPQGLHWEWYIIRDDNPEEEPFTAVSCCAGSGCDR